MITKVKELKKRKLTRAKAKQKKEKAISSEDCLSICLEEARLLYKNYGYEKSFY
jgi:hypothetical protein|tara:strand:- start:1625 stop:1786 length:162 start_codon:yes stop_codon:yes gene_type:complete